MGQLINIAERMAKGERVIAKAKAAGKDVAAWEDHLAKLKAMAQVKERLRIYPKAGLFEASRLPMFFRSFRGPES